MPVAHSVYVIRHGIGCTTTRHISKRQRHIRLWHDEYMLPVPIAGVIVPEGGVEDLDVGEVCYHRSPTTITSTQGTDNIIPEHAPLDLDSTGHKGAQSSTVGRLIASCRDHLIANEAVKGCTGFRQ